QVSGVQFQVVAVVGAHHQPMAQQAHRIAVGVFGRVPDPDPRHRRSTRVRRENARKMLGAGGAATYRKKPWLTLAQFPSPGIAAGVEHYRLGGLSSSRTTTIRGLSGAVAALMMPQIQTTTSIGRPRMAPNPVAIRAQARL